MDNFLSQLFQRLPEGSPNILQALGVLKDNAARQREQEYFGGYTMDQPLNTAYGRVESTTALDEDVQRAMAERSMALADERLKQQGGIPTNPMQQEVAPALAQQYEPEVMGAQSEITPELYRKIRDRFVKNAGTVKPDLPYRRDKQKAKENAEYVGKYIDLIFQKAPQYNLDPVMMAAIAAQESGWGGQRYGNNLIGYGKFDVMKDLDTDYSELPLEGAVDSLLKKVSSDWGGQYQNKRTPEEFVSGKYKWNVHPSWVENVGIIRNNLIR